MSTFKPLPGASPGSGLDMSTFKPLSAAAPINQQPQTMPSPAHDAQSADLAANTKGEGTYQMKNPQGLMVAVPYSNVHRALDQGHLFADKGTLQQYARDHAADPLSEDRVDQWMDKHPYLSRPLQGLIGAGTGLDKTLTGLLPAPTTRAGTELQLAAATPTRTAAEGGGEGVENLAEFFSGDELATMLGKAGTAMGITDKLKAMTGLAQTIEKYPMVAKLLKIGASAAKQGTIAGGQTYLKTGDAGAAATTAGETAAAGPVLDALGAGGAAVKAAVKGPAAEAAPMVEKTVAGVKIPVAEEAANAVASPTAQASAQAYGELARGAITPHLEALNAAPKLVEDTLATTHDLTGAADRMQQTVLNPLYDSLNEATGGKFRALNAEVQQAQKLARGGLPENVAAYKNKLAEMDNLLDSYEGQQITSKGNLDQLNKEIETARVAAKAGDKTAAATYKTKLAERQSLLDNPGTQDFMQKVKAAWTQSYVLDDLGDMWDRNLNGAPGASKVSQEQRGLNGNGLMDGIQKAIKIYGRDRIETALGPGRLENFEDIARWNQTNAKRKAFNIGLREVAANMPQTRPMGEWGKRAVAMTAGGVTSHVMGGSPYMGMVAGEAAYEGTRAALNAIKMNPQIGKNFMFALESGATAAKYGPFVATMIQKQQTEAARERMATEATSRQGETMAEPNPRGLVEPGNLPIWNRPTIQNADGSHSSELSISMQDDQGHEVLIPTIAGGKFLTPDGKMPPLVNGKVPPAEDWNKYPEWRALKEEAWNRFERTGEHLGKFDNPDDADAYAEVLHNRGTAPQ